MEDTFIHLHIFVSVEPTHQLNCEESESLKLQKSFLISNSNFIESHYIAYTYQNSQDVTFSLIYKSSHLSNQYMNCGSFNSRALGLPFNCGSFNQANHSSYVIAITSRCLHCFINVRFSIDHE